MPKTRALSITVRSIECNRLLVKIDDNNQRSTYTVLDLINAVNASGHLNTDISPSSRVSIGGKSQPLGSYVIPGAKYIIMITVRVKE